MGSLLGPNLTYAFLFHYEKEWLDSCPIELRPKLYKRYLDDIFVMFRSRNHVKKFVDYMNIRKTIFVLHFAKKSFIPMTYKIGLLETILFCCFSICSPNEKFHEQIAKFKEIFKWNSKPEKFIDGCIMVKPNVISNLESARI